MSDVSSAVRKIDQVEMVEVAPRDGFQSIAQPLPTAEKARCIQALIEAGVRRMEIGSFVSPKAIPQMADTLDLFKQFCDVPGLRLAALVPNLRGADNALDAGVKELVYVVSVSEVHNLNNVRQSVDESLQGLASIARRVREQAGKGRPVMRLDLGTCFDCPYDGLMSWQQVSAVLEKALQLTQGIDLEVAFCDTTGRATPLQVADYFLNLQRVHGENSITWAFHGHDTYGMGVANAMFAIQHGATVLDASAAGLGGCPFAPGATGNTATEDLVYALRGAGIQCGIDLPRLLHAADLIADLPGGKTASHLRNVPRQRVAQQV